MPDGLRQHLEQATSTMARLPALCFTRLLYRAATFKACTDPRDKIYGLLGLAPHKLAASVRVEHDDSNTGADVYAMTVLNHANISQRLEHFHNCTTDGEVTDEAPTWVPGWSSEIPSETYIPAQFAAATTRAHHTFTNAENTQPGDKPRPDILRVCGLRCAEINYIIKRLPPWLERRDTIRRVRKWQPDDLENAKYGPTNEPMRKAYALTLNCSIVKEREPDWILSSTATWVDQDFGDQALFGNSASKPSSTDIRSDVLDAIQRCADRLLRTKEGFMGLGPSDTQAGDIIAIFLGCSTPLALRPSSRGPEHYTVVGECFVYGVQDGNMLLGPLPQPCVGTAAWAEGDRRVLKFLNTETQEVSVEDPRLSSDDLDGWQRASKLVDSDDPTNYDFFRHDDTGELINYDPRLEPERLEKKGVKLNWFVLV